MANKVYSYVENTVHVTSYANKLVFVVLGVKFLSQGVRERMLSITRIPDV